MAVVSVHVAFPGGEGWTDEFNYPDTAGLEASNPLWVEDDASWVISNPSADDSGVVFTFGAGTVARSVGTVDHTFTSTGVLFWTGDDLNAGIVAGYADSTHYLAAECIVNASPGENKVSFFIRDGGSTDLLFEANQAFESLDVVELSIAIAGSSARAYLNGDLLHTAALSAGQYAALGESAGFISTWGASSWRTATAAVTIPVDAPVLAPAVTGSASSSAPTTSAGSTSTPSAVVGSVSIPAPSPSTPDGGGFPTASSQVGTTVGDPDEIGAVTAENGQTFEYDETVITGNVIVWGGGSVTLTNCEVIGAIVVFPKVGFGAPEIVMNDCVVTAGFTVNPLDAGDNLYWGGPLDVTMNITHCWIEHPTASQPSHVEALAGFGFPRGARFTDTTFAVVGGFGDGVTGVTNWYGIDTVFDGCWFGWGGDAAAAFYCMYNRPEEAGGAPDGNTVTDSAFEAGTGGYIYPGNAGEGYSDASYVNCYDFDTSDPLTLPD